jgi:multiple sugar transport system substrate-binding protein
MKKLLWLSMAVLVLLIPVACTDSDDSDDSSKEQKQEAVTIDFQVSGEAEETAVYKTVVEAFHDEYPSVNVELTEIAEKDEHLQRLTTSFAGGDPPEVFLINFREYSQFVVRGAIEPIGPHLEMAGLDTADYYDVPLEAFTFDEELQCFPQNISSLVVYYNTALFKQAGIERPAADWSWDDFRAAAEKLTGDGVRGVGIDPEIIRIAPFIWSNGGEVVDDLDAPTRFTLDQPESREALEFLVGLARDGLIPTEKELAAQDPETRFVTEKLGMLLSSRKDTPVFREALDLKWDVLPLPVAQEPATILHSDAYCISSGTENLDAAIDFVGFAAGENGQTLTALAGRTVPSLESVANSGAFLDPSQPPKSSQVFLDAIPGMQRTPVIPTWPEIEDVSTEILTRAFYEDGYTIDQALEDLVDQTTSLFEEGSSG